MINGITHWDLLSVEKPSRYIGGEWNQAAEKKDALLDVCLSYPDLYELGMSNIALKILYSILDKRSDINVERVFSPWVDFNRLLRSKDVPLFSLERYRPLNQFHLLGITLPYEMTFTNVLEMLELGKIPLLASERTSFPIVIAGGPSASNPAPVAAFFDAILIGDGEEAILEISDVLLNAKKCNADRKSILNEISNIEGFYVPSVPKNVRKRVFHGFHNSPPPLKPVASHVESVHDRSPIEIFRGCIQGCRFCNAGFYYRPKRERKAADLANWSQEIMKNTGDEALGLVSLSTSDFSELSDLVTSIEANLPYPDANFNLPSLRMNDKTLNLIKMASRLKKSGLTFAPEAGTQRLRDIIGKKITEEEILSVIEIAKDSAFKVVKLYFMIGLPFETDEDVDGIAVLVEKIVDRNRRLKLRKEFSISISPFIPKPFTPFQWSEQISGAELERRRKGLISRLRKTGVKVSWRDEFLCTIEAVLARGDEQAGRLLLAAHAKGCHFDGWNEHFKPEKWREAFDECQIDISKCIRQRDFSEQLPWSFIDFRVPEKYFRDEYTRAMELAGGKNNI
ncbi:MAG: radical SAM protein [Candidatus Riflebacteria bacterium]|nr:radical SAM protein [Candidatus Riflebacteria bacterium]